MPQTVNGLTVIATKMASGNVKLQFQNAVGGIIFVVSIPSADFTALNTSVNGGSTGASSTKAYAQDNAKNDYDHDYNHGEGN